MGNGLVSVWMQRAACASEKRLQLHHEDLNPLQLFTINLSESYNRKLLFI